ncbi:MAG: hypothetical protein GY696_24525, partial [Gammaproteobacteria bacterium]|nr:hypothetical protein [Gammaproteobacteria bacterium]
MSEDSQESDVQRTQRLSREAADTLHAQILSQLLPQVRSEIRNEVRSNPLEMLSGLAGLPSMEETYDGRDPSGFAPFAERFIKNTTLCGWDEEKRKLFFPSRLRGTAFHIYEAISDHSSMTAIIERMTELLAPLAAVGQDAMVSMTERKQGPNERCHEYAYALIALIAQCDVVEAAKMQECALKFFLHGLRPEIRDNVRIPPGTKFEDAVFEAQAVENALLIRRDSGSTGSSSAAGASGQENSVLWLSVVKRLTEMGETNKGLREGLDQVLKNQQNTQGQSDPGKPRVEKGNNPSQGGSQGARANVGRDGPNSNSEFCSRCRGRGHHANYCMQCHRCGRWGHIMRECRNAPRNNFGPREYDNRRGGNPPRGNFSQGAEQRSAPQPTIQYIAIPQMSLATPQVQPALTWPTQVSKPETSSSSQPSVNCLQAEQNSPIVLDRGAKFAESLRRHNESIKEANERKAEELKRIERRLFADDPGVICAPEDRYPPRVRTSPEPRVWLLEATSECVTECVLNKARRGVSRTGINSVRYRGVVVHNTLLGALLLFGMLSGVLTSRKETWPSRAASLVPKKYTGMGRLMGHAEADESIMVQEGLSFRCSYVRVRCPLCWSQPGHARSKATTLARSESPGRMLWVPRGDGLYLPPRGLGKKCWALTSAVTVSDCLASGRRHLGATIACRSSVPCA